MLKTVLNEKWVVFLIVLAGFGGMLFFYSPTDNWSWDPSYYYAQIRSPIIENDLDFRNETETHGIATKVTVTGLQGSPWPIGPGILWSPFFLLAHVLVLMINPARATGFTSPYIALVSFSSALYGLAGLFVLYKTCRIYAEKYISFLTVLLCLGATPLFYYIFRQPIMAHSTGFLVAAMLFLYYLLLMGERTSRKWSGLGFGVLLGLNFLMRWSGILFVIFPMTYFAREIIRAFRAKDSPEVRRLVVQIVLAGVSFGLTISPQLALWQRLYANFLVMPQGTNTFVASILPLNIFKVFFDTNRGILFWCPFVLIGMLGIFRIPNREIRISTAICVFSQVVLIGYRNDWYSGGGFGARYFIELLPLLAVGFVCLVEGFSLKPVGQKLLAVLALVLIAHQAVLVYAVEQAINGWLDFRNYLDGAPLGLSWQVESFIRLVKNPGLWLAPQPYVDQRRQAILVNLAGGVRDYFTYLIPATAALLTPLAAWAGMWIRKHVTHFPVPVLLSGVILYMLGWAVYLLLVG